MGACVAVDKTKSRKQGACPCGTEQTIKTPNKRLEKLTSAPETRSKITGPVFAQAILGSDLGLVSVFSEDLRKRPNQNFRRHTGRVDTEGAARTDDLPVAEI